MKKLELVSAWLIAACILLFGPILSPPAAAGMLALQEEVRDPRTFGEFTITISPYSEKKDSARVLVHSVVLVNPDGFILNPGDATAFAVRDAKAVMTPTRLTYESDLAPEDQQLIDPLGLLQRYNTDQQFRLDLWGSYEKAYKQALAHGAENFVLRIPMRFVFTEDPQILQRIPQFRQVTTTNPPADPSTTTPLIRYHGRDLAEDEARLLLVQLGVQQSIIDRFFARQLTLAELRDLHALVRSRDDFYGIMVKFKGVAEVEVGAPWPFVGSVTMKPEFETTIPLASLNDGYHVVEDFVVQTVEELKPKLESALNRLIDDVVRLSREAFSRFRQGVYALFNNDPPWIVRKLVGD